MLARLRCPAVPDWPALEAAARAVAGNAYAPYSRYPVGAAGLVDDGRVVTGCNVENGSYGLTLCAECGLVSELHRTGGGRLVAVVVVGGTPLVLTTPCGRCRQLLHEAGGPALEVLGPDGPVPLSSLLPGAWGADVLP
jgi:cytidine deaminase